MKRYVKVCLIIVVLVLIALSVLLFFGKYTTSDIADYEDNLSEKVCGSFAIFPDEVNSETVEDYSYIRYNGLLDNGYQIYLECEYDAESYAQEIVRLSNIEGINNNTDCTYVAINNFDSTYEYAIADEENRTIRYIFLSHFPADKISFDSSYLPEQVISSTDSYNVYAGYDDEIGGWIIEE